MAALGFVALGAGLELLQGLGGARDPSWADGLANAAGAGGGWLLMGTRLRGGQGRVENRFVRNSG